MTQQWNNPPDMQIDTDKNYKAVFKTDVGEMTCTLHAAKVPNTVNNFVFLCKEGFYNDTIFHRVIDDFMAQGGDPTGTGRGGPGYRFEDEFDPDLRHNKSGILSMANAGPDTNGSQFFITHIPTPHLDDRHSVFGEITEGEDVLMAIPARDPMRTDSPAVKIITIEIIEE